MIVETPTITKIILLHMQRNLGRDHANSKGSEADLELTLAFKLKHICDIYLKICEVKKHQVLRPTSSMSQRSSTEVQYQTSALSKVEICRTSKPGYVLVYLRPRFNKVKKKVGTFGNGSTQVSARSTTENNCLCREQIIHGGW